MIHPPQLKRECAHAFCALLVEQFTRAIEHAQRATDVSTKVPTRKRFHENLFASSKTKALSSRFVAPTADNECAFVARERRQHAATLYQQQLHEQKPARKTRANDESAFNSNEALSA